MYNQNIIIIILFKKTESNSVHYVFTLTCYRPEFCSRLLVCACWCAFVYVHKHAYKHKQSCAHMSSQSLKREWLFLFVCFSVIFQQLFIFTQTKRWTPHPGSVIDVRFTDSAQYYEQLLCRVWCFPSVSPSTIPGCKCQNLLKTHLQKCDILPWWGARSSAIDCLRLSNDDATDVKVSFSICINPNSSKLFSYCLRLQSVYKCINQKLQSTRVSRLPLLF